jgi:hypothetical protein
MGTENNRDWIWSLCAGNWGMSVQHSQWEGGGGVRHPTLSFSAANTCEAALRRSSTFESQAVSTLSPPVRFLFLNVLNDALSTAQITKSGHKQK